MSSRAPSIAILVALVATFWGLVVHGRGDIVRYVEGSLPAAPPSAELSSGGARADTLVPLKISVTALGVPPVPKFAFDPAVADRVVGCNAVSVDGGRTWPALMAGAVVRPMILGGLHAVAPVPGPDGRFLCGDMILPGRHVPAAGQGDVHPATEWDGQAFTAAGLPPATSDFATQPVPTSRVAYAPDGRAIAARGRELLWPDGRYEAAGEFVAFAVDGRGRIVAASRRGRETDLMAADSLGAVWTRVQAPGPVRDVAAAGERIFVAADLLGIRDAEGGWRWLQWPANLQAERLSIAGDTVLAWGRLALSTDHGGALAVSHDGGKTMRVAVLDQRPLWMTLDPHHPKQVLAILESRGQRQLARLTLD
jgi:hypothetical protein